MLHFIYVLKDPRTYAVRYVGMTVDLQRRYVAHLTNPSCELKYAWIRILTDMGLKPIMEVIERAGHDKQHARIRERHWIRYYIEQGATLLNTRMNIQTVSKQQREEVTQKPVQEETQCPRPFRSRLYRALDCFSNFKTRKLVERRLMDFDGAQIDYSPTYSLRTLINCLPCSRAQACDLLWIPEYALERILAGQPVPEARIDYILNALSWIYGHDLTQQNVTGFLVKKDFKSCHVWY